MKNAPVREKVGSSEVNVSDVGATVHQTDKLMICEWRTRNAHMFDLAVDEVDCVSNDATFECYVQQTGGQLYKRRDQLRVRAIL